MSGQIDPRLSAGSILPPSQYGDPAQKPPLPAAHQQQSTSFNPGSRSDSLRVEANAYANTAHSSPQPYYNYPPPQQQQLQHTPQQQHHHHAVTSSTGSLSNQASPEQQLAYQLSTADNDAGASPEADLTGAEVGGDGQNGDDPKRPRACEACRGLKVRCDQDPAHPEIPCKRCAKAGRPCVITQPSRKRQKKADSRVAELEKKLDALTAALQQTQGGGHGHSGGHFGAGQASGGAMATAQIGQQYNAPNMARPGSTDGGLLVQSRKRQRTDEEASPYDGAANPTLSSRNSTNPSNPDDPVAKHFSEIETAWAPTTDSKRYLHHTTPEEFTNRINSFINPEMAATIFDRYLTNLAPHLPAVVFPPGTTATSLFAEKPILYVCILSAASFGTLPPDISKSLAQEAVGAIADCVVRNGAKSLELIQAMQVTALWYKPPEKAEQTNFYQIVHMAAVMALDIGLGKRFNPAKARRGFGGPGAQFAPGPGRVVPQDSDTLEARRAWLTCYYLCASASMVLRRPNLVRWTNYMKECIEVLESHPDAFPSDKLFCQHVKIQHICEDIGLQFLMDDNTATISITDPKVTYALNVLENQLKTWKEGIPVDCRGPSLQFFEHVTNLYLHEIALHFNHNIEDFRLPFTEESLKSVTNTSGDALTQNQMAALEACLRAAHGILDIMLSFDVQTVKSLPMLLYFVRCVYAIVILIKMHVAVCTPGSELGKMMQPGELKVEHYLDSLMTLFGYVAKEGGRDFEKHPKILRILAVLREWFGRHKENVAAQQRGEKEPNSASSATLGQAANEHERQHKEREREKVRFNQTPLHLLSQVATGNQRQQQQGSSGSSTQGQQDWTFNTPLVMDYSKQPPPGHPDARMPKWEHTTQQASSSTQPDPNVYPPMPSDQQQQQMGMGGYGLGGMSVDPTNGDYGWGSGFEQAMDIALGGVDGLQGGGLDNWFLGDSMAPFGFAPGMGGDMGGGVQGGGGW